MKDVYVVVAGLLLFVSTTTKASGPSESIDHYFSRRYLETAYDKAARDFVPENRDRYYDFKELSEIEKKIPSPSRILDAGCGSGMPVLKHFAGKGHEIIGVDISQDMLKLVPQNVSDMRGITLEHRDIALLDYPDNHFDLITSVYTIFHLPREEHENIFKNFYRMMKKGALAYFTLSNASRVGGHDAFHGIQDFIGTKLPYSHYTLKEYKAMLERIGFKILSMHNPNLGGYTLTWVTVQK